MSPVKNVMYVPVHSPLSAFVVACFGALRGVPAEMGAGRRRLYAGWKQGRDLLPVPPWTGPSARLDDLHGAIRFVFAILKPCLIPMLIFLGPTAP